MRFASSGYETCKELQKSRGQPQRPEVATSALGKREYAELQRTCAGIGRKHQGRWTVRPAPRPAGHARALAVFFDRIPAGSARKDVVTAPLSNLPTPISQMDSPGRLLRACARSKLGTVASSTSTAQHSAERSATRDRRREGINLRQCLHDVCWVHATLRGSPRDCTSEHLALKAQRRGGRSALRRG